MQLNKQSSLYYGVQLIEQLERMESKYTLEGKHEDAKRIHNLQNLAIEAIASVQEKSKDDQFAMIYQLYNFSFLLA